MSFGRELGDAFAMAVVVLVVVAGLVCGGVGALITWLVMR